MQSERPDLSRTIAELVRSAKRVVPLEPPSIRLTRWVITSTALAAVSVAISGVRGDAAVQMTHGWFVARASATLAIAVAAASVAFLASVPGLQPSRLIRALPLTACLVWAVMLVGMIAAAPSPLYVLLQAAPHPSCVVLIVATAFPPAFLLVRMLQKAAPMQARWTGGLAGLAGLGTGALGTQFVCTNDAAAHHLLWHFTPVVVLTLAGMAIGSSLFGRPHQQEPPSRSDSRPHGPQP